MSIVAIANQAGSAGKTTTAVTLAALLAETGRTVRLVDLDAQANASHWLTADQIELTIGDVLLRGTSLDKATTSTALAGLDLVPATASLDDAAVQLGRTTGGEQRLRLALESSAAYDVTLIDCPGSLGVLTVAAFVAAGRDVVTVTTPTLKELAGIPKVADTITDVADAYNPKLRLAAIVPCAVPAPAAGAMYAEAMQLVTDTYPDLTTPAARRSVRVPEAYAQQRVLHQHDPHGGVTQDYRTILDDLTKRGLW